MTAPLESDVATFQAPPRKRLGFMPGQLVVRVHEDALRPTVGVGRVSLDAATAEALPEAVTQPLDLLVRESGARGAEPLFGPRRAPSRRLARHHRVRLAAARSVAESESDELAGMAVIDVPQREVSPQLLRRVASSPAIAFAEPMPARWLSAAARADPKRNRQWGLRAIHWFEARRPSARSVTVAICDTGVDDAHPDLTDSIASYDHESAGARDIVGHGTHVSGIIAARANNDAGITGVAGCRVAMWKVFPDEPYRGDFYVDGTSFLRALNVIATSGAKVLNLSLGGTESSQAEQLLFDRLERFGVTVVAAMGNEYDDGNPTEYPAAYEHVLAVGAVAETDTRSPFSNTGRHIGIAAPGSDILSTLPTTRSQYRPETDYASWSGTSMATPHVAAAAALVGAKHSDWTPADTKEHLRSSATRLADMRGKDWTQAYGNGLLDMTSALASD